MFWEHFFLTQGFSIKLLRVRIASLSSLIEKPERKYIKNDIFRRLLIQENESKAVSERFR